VLVEKKFLDLIVPESASRVVFDAPHAAAPKREYYTGTIAFEVSSRSGSVGIIGRVSRLVADLNRGPDFTPELDTGNYQREAVEQHFASVEEVLRRFNLLENGKVTEPVLMVAIHGIKDSNAERLGCDAVVGTCHLGVCSREVRDWFVDKLGLFLREQAAPFRVGVESPSYSGHSSLLRFRELFGENFNVIQLELSRRLRTEFRKQVVNALVVLADSFERTF